MKRLVSALCVMLSACDGSHGPPADAGTGDAGASERCVPGSSRVVPCENCGSATQVCGQDSRWTDAGACVGAGACAAGTIETESTDRCGTRSRTCSTACDWEEWTQATPDGECMPGEERRDEAACGPSAVQVETCTEACEWSAPECVSHCSGPRRTTPWYAEELCIPSGPFWRGWDLLTDARPVREVTLSSYYMDRYPVTNMRYRACVNDRACSLPEMPEGRTSFEDPTRTRYPVQGVSKAQAQSFCDWDGGRVLPTEAQWEKAARGPSPRMQVYTWGDEFECSFVRCNGPGGSLIPAAADDLPDVRSFYGIDLLVGGGPEWVADLYRADYYRDDESLVDPTGPVDRGTPLQRGYVAGTSVAIYYALSRRTSTSSIGYSPFSTFRCARPASNGEEE